MSQNDLLFSHITVSSTLLCPTKYCVHIYPKGLLFTLHISMCCGRIMLRLRSTSAKILMLQQIKHKKYKSLSMFLRHKHLKILWENSFSWFSIGFVNRFLLLKTLKEIQEFVKKKDLKQPFLMLFKEIMRRNVGVSGQKIMMIENWPKWLNMTS